MLEITNHGSLITARNYWDSELAEAGKVIVSPNAGAIRCLIPPSLNRVVGELRQSKYAIVSVGQWEGREGVEILWEDHTDSPHAWHLTADSCLLIPGDPGDSQWIITLWNQRRGQPHKALERPAKWRRVDRLPMRPWS